MPRLLPTLAVVDVLPDDAGFRYRLVGTRITRIADRDATARMIDDDLYGAGLDRMIAP